MVSQCGAQLTKPCLTTLFYYRKKALRVITSANFHAHTKPIMKENNILSLEDQRHLQIASLMWDHGLLQSSRPLWDLDHNALPPSLSSYFKKRNDVYQQHTRLAGEGKFNIPKTRTETHGSRSFQVQGSLILNHLKDLDIYKNADNAENADNDKKKSSFLANLKKIPYCQLLTTSPVTTYHL